jgi:hypothetical protein
VLTICRNDVSSINGENAAGRLFVNAAIWEMRCLAEPPSLQATAAPPQPALLAAPMHPQSYSSRPSGTSGTYRPLGPAPTARVRMPCRKVATISSTSRKNQKRKGNKRVSHVIKHTQKKKKKTPSVPPIWKTKIGGLGLVRSIITYMVYVEDFLVRW